MCNIYLYLIEDMADWEISYITSELNSKRYFKKDVEVSFKTVGLAQKSIKTMGGLTVTPDCLLSDVILDNNTLLILPGSNTWLTGSDNEVIDIVGKLLEKNGKVAAICGATVALANAHYLDNVKHTSNGVGFLDMFSKEYKGSGLYVDSLCTVDGNIITAGAPGNLEFARAIIEELDVFSESTKEAWYNYFKTGKAEYFFSLMNSINQ